jgi:hypothetical protein
MNLRGEDRGDTEKYNYLPINPKAKACFYNGRIFVDRISLNNLHKTDA